MTLKALNELMASVYLVEDQNFLKLVLAVVVSARIPTTPAWLMVVGPPGSGKTEWLNAIKDCWGITPISSLTTSTLISGMSKKGTQSSLLLRMPAYGGILLFKDFTSILSLYADARAVIVATLREIHDGAVSKPFGTGETVAWKGRMGLLAAVTDTIYTSQEQIAAMGQRFLTYQPLVGNRYDVTMRALTNSTNGMTERRAEIASAVKNYLDVEMDVFIRMYNKNDLPDPPQDFLEDVASLAELATRARSAVKRDTYSKDHHIIFSHTPEMPTRLAEQLISLTVAFMIINQRERNEAGLSDEPILLSEDRQLIFRLALDCIPTPRRDLLRRLTKHYMASAYALATDMNMPYATIKSWLEELNVLGVIDAKKYEDGKISWYLNTSYRALLSKFLGIEKLDKEMDEPEREVESLPNF